MDEGEVRAAVAATARMLTAAGLVEAFGHVSARLGGGLAITTVRPLATATADDVAVLDADGAVTAGPAGELPLERALHAAVYARRPDVGAICRGHPPGAVAWGLLGAGELPLHHGLGLLAGRRVSVHGDGDLVTTAAQAAAVADALGDAHALLLRANGALAVGRDLAEAATRLWFTDERARVALAHPAGDLPAELWDRRARHTPAELRRATRWFAERFGRATPEG